MSEEKTPETQDAPETAPASGGFARIALFAGVLGIAVGGGLYAFSSINGKPQETASAQCSVKQTLRAKIDAAASGELAAFRALDRPYSAEKLAFNDKDGKPITMADFKGKTVLFNLWATWCVPCRVEMPYLQTLNKELGGDDFEVVAVSVDLGEPGKPKAFYDEINLKDLGFFHDPELSTLSTLKKAGLALGLPATLLIGKDGCVLGNLNGPAKWASDDAKALIKAAM